MKKMTTKKKQQKTMLKMKKVMKDRMFEEFLASTVMTHQSNGCLFYFSVGSGGGGGSVFYFSPHNKSYKKCRTPLSSLHFVAIKGSFYKTHLLATCKTVFRGMCVCVCVWLECSHSSCVNPRLYCDALLF